MAQFLKQHKEETREKLLIKNKENLTDLGIEPDQVRTDVND